ncbi:MAG: DUF488 domain-containing protein, partial [Desulforhabdus sp.]|nr:DUF488 domain-containing protein [Desulforhabdus sp.]
GKITVLADVRLNPISRKPNFSKRALAQELANHHIQYVHFRELGTPQNLRNELAETKDYGKFKVDYRNYLDTRQHALEELDRLVKSKVVALMCLEADPERCHRSVIAAAIKEIGRNGLRIRAL